MVTVSDHTALQTDNGWWWSGNDGRPAFLTFSFETQPQSYISEGGFTAGFVNSFQALSAAEQGNARSAMNEWANASGLVVFEVPAGQGDIRFGKYNFALYPEQMDAAGFAFYPSVFVGANSASESLLGGDIFLTHDAFADGGILRHEIGHALGFKHPFEGDPVLEPGLDNRTNTVLSYSNPTPTFPGLGYLDRDAVAFKYGDMGADGSHLASWSWNSAQYILTQTGAAGADAIRGVAVRDVINGLGGNDTIFGGSGADTLDGGDDADGVFGGLGNDSLLGGGGDDTLDGDTGIDTIRGGDGADAINGGGSDDYLFGDGGDDNLAGYSGRDSMLGGDGADTLQGFGSHDSLYGGNGDDDLRGGFGRDLLGGSGNNDVLRGFEGEDRLFGGAGNDTLLGNDDNDMLTGGGGTDRLKGDAGNDTLVASFGADTVTGGAGDDEFYFRKTHGADVYDDFVAGAGTDDYIRLVAFGAAFDTFAEVIAAASDNGTHTTIDFGGGDTVLLLNVLVGDLHQDDFIFG